MKKLNRGLPLGTSLNARAGLWSLYVVRMRLTIFCFLVSAVFPSQTRARAPVFEFNHADSSISST